MYIQNINRFTGIENKLVAALSSLWAGNFINLSFKITRVYGCSVTQSSLTLCDPMDCSPPGSSVHEIFQAGILEWLPLPTPRDLPDPGIEPESPASPALAGGFFITELPGKPSDNRHLHVTGGLTKPTHLHCYSFQRIL